MFIGSLILNLPCTMAEVLTRIKNTGNLSLVLSETTKGNFLLETKSLKQSKEELLLDVFYITNPARLVIDVLDHPTKSAVTKPIKNQYLSQLRIGVHPGKTRIVIDLTKEKEPKYSVIQKTTKSVHVEFSLQDEKTNGEKTNTKTDAETAPTTSILPVSKSTQQPTTEKPKSTTSTLSTSISTTTTTIKPIATKEAPVPQSSQSTVTSIAFKRLEGDKLPAVLITVENLGNYSLSKKAKNLYELVLENTHFAGSHLVLPYFPPDTFDGVEAVIASQAGEKAILKIYVNESYLLNPFRTKGELWLKVSPHEQKRKVPEKPAAEQPS